MEKNITVVGAEAERIRDTGPTLPRIDSAEFAAGLGAEPCGDELPGGLDLLSLAELGNELLKRLRSSRGTPVPADPTHRCEVPLSDADVAALGEIVGAIQRATGAKPSLGQIARVVAYMHLETLRTTAGE